MKTFAILCLVAAALAAPTPSGPVGEPAPPTPAELPAGPPAMPAPLPCPAPAGPDSAARIADAAVPRRQPGQASRAKGVSAATQSELEKGIQKNLDIQAQELAGIQALQKMVNSAATQGADFKAQQNAVLQIQQNGINVRGNNQKLAKEINSPAIDGLAVVAGAQVKEFSQVQGLQGNQADAGTLALLVQEVQDGTKQNQENLEAARSQKRAR